MVDTDGSAQDFPISPEDAISAYGARIHADGDELYGLEGDPIGPYVNMIQEAI
jgi:hypothetical protein